MANRKLTLEEVKQREFIKMSELAELNGVRYSTVKYYTELGLLPFEQQGKRLAKKYNREVASKRLQEILKLKGKGKTIPDIINYFISNS